MMIVSPGLADRDVMPAMAPWGTTNWRCQPT